MKNRLPDPSEICALEFELEFRRFGIRSVSASIDINRPILRTLPRDNMLSAWLRKDRQRPSRSPSEIKRGKHADQLSTPPGPSRHWCATPLPFAPRDLRRQRAQLRLPETPELTDPFVHRLKSRSIHRIESPLRLRPYPQSSAVLNSGRALRITSMTTSGWESIGTWLLATSVIVAPMRLETQRWRSGCTVWSCVARTYQLGFDFHAMLSASSFCWWNRSKTGA